MQDKEIEARLQEIENTLEELVERQKETTDVVQGYLDSLAGTIREAEEKIQKATEDAVEQLTEEPAYPTSLRDAIERIDESVESIRDSVDRLERVDAEEGGRKEDAAEVDEDELYEKAREFVVAEGKASTSLLQRRFKVGYGRACRIMDALEGRGVISGSDGTNRPREVLVAGSGGSAPEPLEEDEKDECLDAVAAFAREEGRIAPSMIQRRFRVGYARAARIMDQLEQVGVVGPSDGRSGVPEVVQ